MSYSIEQDGGDISTLFQRHCQTKHIRSMFFLYFLKLSSGKEFSTDTAP